MRLTFDLASKSNWLLGTVHFFKSHFKTVIGLGLIAAFGRVTQLGGFGEISYAVNIVLEVIVESARISIFLYVLGLGSIKRGGLRLRNFFLHKYKRKLKVALAIRRLKTQWTSMVVSVIGFIVIASLINYLIDLVAYETCLYLSLKNDGILAASSSEWTILLFLKNLSVIPFTLIFEGVFLLSIANKFDPRPRVKLE